MSVKMYRQKKLQYSYERERANGRATTELYLQGETKRLDDDDLFRFSRASFSRNDKKHCERGDEGALRRREQKGRKREEARNVEWKSFEPYSESKPLFRRLKGFRAAPNIKLEA